MKKFLLTVVVFLSAFTVLYAQQDTVSVTIYMNAATVPDTVTANTTSQVRGGVAPLTWGDDTGGVLEHVQGDLWRTTLRFASGDTVPYKFNVRTDLVQGGGGWEANLNTANTNRELIVPTSDTTLQVQFFNKTTGSDPLFRPYEETDSLDIYFRVNMQGWDAFNAENQYVGVRGAFPESGWASSLVLSPETPHASPSEFTYPAEEFWSGATKIDPADFSVGDTIAYKFVLLNGDQPDSPVAEWEGDAIGGLPRENPWVLNEPADANRFFHIPTQDSTIVWTFFNEVAPIQASNADTVALTFQADMTRAINTRGFSPGDTVFVRAGFSGTANLLTDINLVNVEGTNFWLGTDTLVATQGGLIEYDYRLIKFGQEIRESYFDFDFVPDSPSEQGRAERRRADISGAETMIVDDDPDPLSQRRQPFFPSNEVLAQDVLVTFEVDMRPAIFELLLSTQEGQTDTLFDIQGNRDITEADSVLSFGVWINGLSTGDWQTWGGTLENDTTRMMYDDGTHGDAFAGDSVFTRQYNFSPDSVGVGSQGVVGQVFKFGIKGGDNEGGFGNNHVANVDDSGPTFTISSQFGSIDPKKYDHWDFNNMVPIVTSISIDDENLPNTFSLDQNYPNPFNPETTIRYAIPKDTEVKLTVYNLLGQKVATLIDKEQFAGQYTITWSGLNDARQQVSTGVYIYKLEAGDFIQTRKMLLIK